jgi:hypothetical protein
VSTNQDIQQVRSLLSQAEIKRQAALAVVRALDETFAERDRLAQKLREIAGDAIVVYGD